MVKHFFALLSLLSRREKAFSFFLAGLMIVQAVMELAGIGSIFTYIGFLADTGSFTHNRILSALYDFFHFTNNLAFLFFLGVVVFVILVLRGILSCLNLYFQSKFAFDIRNRLSMELLSRYTALPYQEFITQHTAVLTKNIIEEIGNVIACVTMFLQFFTELVISLALLGLLLIANPQLVMFITVIFGGITVLIVRATKKRISRIGLENEHCSRLTFKSVAEILGGLKEINVFGVKPYFLEQFRKPLLRSSHLNLKYKLIGGFPGMVLNLMAFGVLLAVMLFLLKYKGSITAALPFIGLIALSLQRLLPAVDKIYNAIGLIRKYEPGILIIKEALDRFNVAIPPGDRLEHPIIEPMQFNRAIRFENVTFCYRLPYKKALDAISFEIFKNESVGIIGGSGAGKSTLVDVLLGLLESSQGKVFCDELELAPDNWRSFNRLVGYVPQQTFLLDATIKENIAFGIAPQSIDMKAVRTAVRTAQLESFIGSLPEKFDTSIGERGVKLSGGQRQRLGIARALYHNPQILILDEATNSLDLPTEADFLDSLRVLMGQKTIVIIAHRLSSLTLCDRLILIKDGRFVVSGPKDELRARSAEFNDLYDGAERK